MGKKYEVLILNDVNEKQKREIENRGEICSFVYKNKKDITKEDISKADIVIGNPKVELLGKNAENLKWLQLCSAGVDEYKSTGVLPENCVLTNATGAYGLAVSEHMLSLVFMLSKKLNLYLENQFDHKWKGEGKITSIYNSTFLIIGLGDIGSEFGKKVKALGGYTIALVRTKREKKEYIDELYTLDEIDDIIPRADVVAMVIPGNDENYHFMDEKRIKKLKKDAIIINAGRGTTLDIDALCNALNKGELRGAALDVTEPEPLPENHPAWNAKNLVITPHVAGGFHLDETLQRFVNIAAYNLEAFLNNKEMKNVIKR